MIGNLRRVSLTLFVILLALGFFASREDPEVTVYSDPSRFDGFTMGTTYSVQFAAKVNAVGGAHREAKIGRAHV